MASYRDVVNDDYGRPIPGVLVYVFNKDGSLASLASGQANPITTDTFGAFAFEAADAVYAIEYRFAGITKRLDNVIVGNPAEYVGLPGPADAFRVDLDALRSAAVTDGKSDYDGSVWFWTLGDFSGTTADDLDTRIVKSDSVPLSQGAWVRQRAKGITLRQDGAGSITRTAEDKANDIVNAKDKGVVADGVANDLAALQAAVDTASTLGRPLQLPAGIIRIDAPLDLRGRAVDMRGVPGRTTIKAGAAMTLLINAEEADATYYTPFNIQDVYLDGDNKVTNANLSIRHRHGYDLSNVWSFNAFRAFRERDCYLSRHWNLRTGTCQIGYHVEGSNHSSSYTACSAVGCAASGILLEANGAEPDGNHALLFTGCDVEFGDGFGVVVSAGTSARFDGCYLGENIGKAVVYNTGGTVEINGGISFWGATAESYLAQPIGGRTIFRGARLAAQDNGFVTTIAYCTDTQVAAGTGVVRFQDVDGYVPTGGDPVLPGNMLDHGPQRDVFAPRWGRIYGVLNGDATVATDVGAGGKPNRQRVTCASITGPAPKIGLFAPLINTFWKTGEPMYMVLVYRSSKPVIVRTADEPLGDVLFNIGLAPATATTKTYVKLDPTPGNAANGVFEFFIDGAAVGDFFELDEVYLADATMHKQCVGDLGALYKC